MPEPLNRLGTGRVIADSTPVFAPRPSPTPGAPNVVVIVLDDTGFAQLGCFGSDIGTPNIDRLARGGLRYNRFHVTSLCSPTRACLLTGRNHHAVGMGFLADIPMGFPGYNGRIPSSAATLPRILGDAGYNTFAVGKWHLAPRWELSASGPFRHWPLGLGFERFYGFLHGDTNQWTPELVSDNGFVDPPAGPEDGYHLSEDLADRAIRLVKDQHHATPDRPFFLYFATGAMHAPHHVGREWIERYRGRFDDGWEDWRRRAFARQQDLGIVPSTTILTPRPPWVQDWAGLSRDERRLFARMMEVFAGYVSHTDAQIGRVVDFLDEIGALDNTLLMLLSDNGASAEGGPLGSLNEHRFTHDMTDDMADTLARIDDLGGFRAYNHYPWGWAWAGNTPLRLWKRYTWLGGVRTPLVVHWPVGIGSRGEVRAQFCHAVDVLPTVLEASGEQLPALVDGVAQQPVDGASLMATFDDADAPSPRPTQYFEMLGSRAIYSEGWKATTDHVGRQITVEWKAVDGSHAFEDDHWALFNLDEDFAEANDLSDQQPHRVKRLIELWWAEAGRNHVLPLEDSLIARALTGAMEPAPYPPRRRTMYRPGGGPIDEATLPSLGAGFLLTAEVDVGAEGRPHGILCALGDWNNGWAWYLLDGRPVVVFALFSRQHRIAADVPAGRGAHQLTIEYRREGRAGGPVTLGIDGEHVAAGRLPANLPFRWQIGSAGLLIGRDRGFPVSDDYRPPFPFSGMIDHLVFEIPTLAPGRPSDEAGEISAALRRE